MIEVIVAVLLGLAILVYLHAHVSLMASVKADLVKIEARTKADLVATEAWFQSEIRDLHDRFAVNTTPVSSDKSGS